MSRTRVSLVAAMAAALALTAAPAHAGPGDPVACFQAPEGNPTQNMVTVNGFDVTVTPGTLPGDADSARLYAQAAGQAANAYAWCVQGDTYTVVSCWLARGYPPSYVEIYSDGSGVKFHGNEFVADLTALCPPL